MINKLHRGKKKKTSHEKVFSWDPYYADDTKIVHRDYNICKYDYCIRNKRKYTMRSPL